jgi:hypothetical protein
MVLAASAIILVLWTGCANKDSYEDPNYTLQRNLTERNQRWDNMQKRMGMRRNAQDERYQSWFNSVMQ